GHVTGVQTCALPIYLRALGARVRRGGSHLRACEDAGRWASGSFPGSAGVACPREPVLPTTREGEEGFEFASHGRLSRESAAGFWMKQALRLRRACGK